MSTSRRAAPRRTALVAAVLAGSVVSAAGGQTASASDDFGQHVVVCSQEHGFSGSHNPGTHQGISGWDPTHVC